MATKLIRDEHGNWVAGFSAPIGHSEVFLAEQLEILHGLRMCWDMGFRSVVVHSYSTLAMSLICMHDTFHIYAAI